MTAVDRIIAALDGGPTRVEVAAAIGATVLVAVIASYGLAPRTVPTLDDLARPGCTVVEHGPTGPEDGVTLGRTVERCADGSAIVTTWHLTTGVVIDVDHDPHQLTAAEVADLADRLDVIRDQRGGERFAR
jgi:hypothetical protein